MQGESFTQGVAALCPGLLPLRTFSAQKMRNFKDLGQLHCFGTNLSSASQARERVCQASHIGPL